MNVFVTREDLLAYFEHLSYTLEETFIKCYLKSVRRNCSDLFTPVVTNSGKYMLNGLSGMKSLSIEPFLVSVCECV